MSAVTMFNPHSQVTQRASEAAYERIYRGEGWILVEEGGAYVPPSPIDAFFVMPDGMSVSATEAWVREGGERAAERARVALEAELDVGEMARKTLVARMQAVIEAAEDDEDGEDDEDDEDDE